MKKVITYSLPADGDNNYRVTPLAYLERLVRRAPVVDPSQFPIRLLSRCLHLMDFVRPVLQ
eukprot:813335-Prymnesium_polylepis.2